MGNLDHWMILYNNPRFNTLYIILKNPRTSAK